jgi:hypothetical protein
MDFHKKIFLKFIYIHVNTRKINDPWVGDNFDPKSFILTNFFGVLQEDFLDFFLSFAIETRGLYGI